jgi:hypothetical protein
MNMISTVRRFLVLPAVLALATLTGCASQMTRQEMTPAPVAVAKQHPQSVTVSAAALPAGNPAGDLIVATELRSALSDAIVGSKAFADVKAEGGDYLLSVQIFSLETPAFGISFTSKVEAGWTLKQASTGTVVWQESIKSEHTTGGGEAFAGAERSKMSIAGAIKKNIAIGLERIGAATL